MSTSSNRNIAHILTQFKTISLEEMDDVKFLKRSDTKYVFHIDVLEKLLNLLQSNCEVLSIKDQHIQDYETVYFDTSDMRMYHEHHNGLRSRLKVRAREYVNSQLFFLELKTKNNKQITTKKRINIDNLESAEILKDEQQFISNKTPFKKEQLQATVINNFSRITLVNKLVPERITIDFNLSFSKPDNGQIVNLPNVSILEIKKNRGAKNQELDEILKQCGIYSMGFSKYCFGAMLLNPELKKNRFKPRLQRLRKNRIIN